MINVLILLVVVAEVVEAVTLKTAAFRGCIVFGVAALCGIGGALIWYFLNGGVSIKLWFLPFQSALSYAQFPAISNTTTNATMPQT